MWLISFMARCDLFWVKIVLDTEMLRLNTVDLFFGFEIAGGIEIVEQAANAFKLYNERK